MFIYRGAEAVGQKDLENDVQECKGRDVTNNSSCWVKLIRHVDSELDSYMQRFILVIFFFCFPMKVV